MSLRKELTRHTANNMRLDVNMCEPDGSEEAGKKKGAGRVLHSATRRDVAGGRKVANTPPCQEEPTGTPSLI